LKSTDYGRSVGRMEPATQSAGKVQFEELGKERTFSIPELQTRADANPLAPGRKQYRVQIDQQDAAYLSFDTFWDGQLNLYEIFVAESYRGQGIGSKCISFAVDLAKELGKPRVTVRPTPLSGQSKDNLIAWYVRRDFVPTKDESELLEIALD
jgi:GNAT superfamily N-acetyltransferase